VPGKLVSGIHRLYEVNCLAAGHAVQQESGHLPN
jgi:hypothetical protein